MVDRKRDLDLILADAWTLGALGLGLLSKPAGPVAAQGAVQLRPILPKYRAPGMLSTPGCYPRQVRNSIRCECRGIAFMDRWRPRKVLRVACTLLGGHLARLEVVAEG